IFYSYPYFHPCRVRIDKLNQEYLIYFAGTNTGSIYKIVQFIKFGQRQSVLLDILDISKNEPIREMEISQKTGSLYIATDHSVKQIDLAMCNRRYDSCFRCVKDPYCGWDKEYGACKPYQLGLLQDVGNETSGICDSSVLKKKITASYGQTLHLSCFVRLPEVLRHNRSNGCIIQRKKEGKWKLWMHFTLYIHSWKVVDSVDFCWE
uniref:Sema domain-containing protein n=1 Tax=Megaselia scalaris TaxID=36166 RepID=T1H437_MEGSC